MALQLGATSELKQVVPGSTYRDARDDLKTTGEQHMEINLRQLRNLLSKRKDEIEQIVEGTGYLARTVIGVGTFLLDNEGNLDLLSAKQLVTFEKFLKPLLKHPTQGNSGGDLANS